MKNIKTKYTGKHIDLIDLRLILFTVFLLLLYLIIPSLKWEWEHGFNLFHSFKYLLKVIPASHGGKSYIINMSIGLIIIIAIHFYLYWVINNGKKYAIIAISCLLLFPISFVSEFIINDLILHEKLHEHIVLLSDGRMVGSRYEAKTGTLAENIVLGKITLQESLKIMDMAEAKIKEENQLLYLICHYHLFYFISIIFLIFVIVLLLRVKGLNEAKS